MSKPGIDIGENNFQTKNEKASSDLECELLIIRVRLSKTFYLCGAANTGGRLSSRENWLVVKRQLFAAMMRPTTHIIHNKSDDPNFST